MSTEPADNPITTVSLIMPVYNEESFIERSLGSVFRQTYPHHLLEVIVADGMSTDRTREIIGALIGKTDLDVQIVDNPKKIAPTALNVAIAQAKGEIIIRVDGHCEIEPDYVTNCVKYLEAGEAEGVGGPIETIGNDLRADAIAVAMSSKFGVGGSAFRTIDDRELYVDTVAFPGYTREIIEKAGPFNEELVRNQDDEYNYRIRKLGGRILLAPDIRSRYYSRSNFKSLWKQYFQYGFWKVRVLQLHPRQMSLRQFVPFLFVTSILALVVASVLFPLAGWLLLLELILYALANVLATFFSGRDLPFRALPLLSFSYLILHVSYGLGFCVGLVRFAGKWFD